MILIRTVILAGMMVMSMTSVCYGRSLDVRVDSLLTIGMDTTRSFDDRVSVFKDAIRLARSGEAMYRLANLYRDDGDGKRLGDAEFWYKGAIGRDRGNTDYRCAYAALLWDVDDLSGAYSQAKKILAADPDHLCGHYYSGKYAAWSMDRNLTTVAIARSKQVTVPFSLRSFGEDRMKQAIHHLTRALEIDADFVDARQTLGLIYYETERYRDMIDLYVEHVRRHPDDPNGYFFIGLGLQAQEKLSRAYRYFLAGLSKMSDEEQSLVKSIVLMTEPDDLRSGAVPLPDIEEQNVFWTERDPLFLSPLNERLMEHCGRVAYANLRFADAHRGLDGWETDKGELYIRYGKPKRRYVRTAEIRIPRFESWDYGAFQIWFANPISSAWRFEGGRIRRVTLNQKADLVERIQERFRDPFEWDRFRVPFQISQFRGQHGQTRLELYYGLSSQRLTIDDRGSGYVDFQALRQGLFLFDAAWDTVYTGVQEVPRLPSIHLKGVERSYALGSGEVSVAPGEYSVVGEAEDAVSRAIGSFRDRIYVRSFSGEGLNISSLLLARRITETDGPQGRDRFTVLPNPMRRFDSGGKGALYFEIYNLTQDDFGRTRYEVTYQLRSLTETGRVQDPRWSTALSYEHVGSTSWEPIYFDLDLDTVPPGLWDARIVVKDLQADRRVEAGETFRVLW